jgi:hypothetical protein
VAIYYRFHPHFGKTLTATKRQSYRGEAVYLIQLQEGPLAYLPVWMTEPTAAAYTISSEPCLPLEALAELRRLLDEAKSCLASEAQRGGDDGPTTAAEPAGRQQI